jgi:hypothetical protein
LTKPDQKRPPSEDAVTETEEVAETESAIGRSVHKWKLATVYLGLALVVSVASVVPFLYGHSLHDHWDAVGKYIVLLAMFLLPAFCYAAWTAYNMHLYFRDVKKINQEYPPDSDDANA